MPQLAAPRTTTLKALACHPQAQVLLHCHDRLVPHLSQPLRLADFLTWALRKGGLLGMLALNGLFLLVTR